ncbi:enolase [Mycolicibacterium neoaurum]|uniref:phosphopyruvate hydratase n=1 Tax=Mycolicibacterium neoaurum TaxID=1795 RepID=UPI00055CB7F9|nr:enolase C-terminal domain-like protein [Mycolicibacterium neoaurum]SDC07664.1 enolase [Mycolicibacterium neoaurum]
MQITSVTARQLLDCKTRPLVEVEITTDSGHVGRGAAPTGSSVGAHEAFILRDGDPAEYNGLSVHRAVDAVNNEIAPALIGTTLDLEANDRLMIDLDGTPNKSRLGGNAIYSTSIALLRATAAVAGLPTYSWIAEQFGPGPVTQVPVPSFNMINGGRYGSVVQPFNEFIVMPYNTTSIQEAVEKSVKVFGVLEDVLTEYLGRKPQVASSYGFASPSSDPREVLRLLATAVERAGVADSMAFALDCASSEMYDPTDETYELNGERVTSDDLIDYTRRLSTEFPFVFIEDLLDEDDWTGYTKAVAAIDKSIILGDDLVVTNRDRLQRAVESSAVEGFILKPNQVGTITEALECYRYADNHQLLAIPSGRSGGVIDDVVMDLSVGLSVPFQKNGAPRSGERIEKLNFLLRVADSTPGCVLADVPAIVKF